MRREREKNNAIDTEWCINNHIKCLNLKWAKRVCHVMKWYGTSTPIIHWNFCYLLSTGDTPWRKTNKSTDEITLIFRCFSRQFFLSTRLWESILVLYIRWSNTIHIELATISLLFLFFFFIYCILSIKTLYNLLACRINSSPLLQFVLLFLL